MLVPMQAYFCGTRGSTPVNGAEQLHYGGYTSCIGLAHTGEPPTLVLDAGTGLQQLPLALHGRAEGRYMPKAGEASSTARHHRTYARARARADEFGRLLYVPVRMKGVRSSRDGASGGIARCAVWC